MRETTIVSRLTLGQGSADGALRAAKPTDEVFPSSFAELSFLRHSPVVKDNSTCIF